MMEKKSTLSVANEITALALINVLDIFKFTLTAKDEEIEERYGSEETAINVAEKYLNIAGQATILEHRLSGWSTTYSQPIKDSEGRAEFTARFYDVKNAQEDEE